MICRRKKRKRRRGLLLCWFISFPYRYKEERGVEVSYCVGLSHSHYKDDLWKKGRGLILC
jgi:hypothetical protein